MFTQGAERVGGRTLRGPNQREPNRQGAEMTGYYVSMGVTVLLS